MRNAYKVITNPLGGFNLLADGGLVTADELRDALGVYMAMAVDTQLINRNIATFAFMLDPRYDTEAEAMDNLKAYLDAKIVTLDPGVWNEE